MKGLGVRAASGAVLLAVVIAAIWLQGLLLMVCIVVAAGFAAHEFYSVVRRAGYKPWYLAGVPLALLLALRGYPEGNLISGVPYVGPSVAAEVLVFVLAVFFALAREGLYRRVSLLAARAEGSPAGTADAPERSPYLAWSDLGLTLAGAVYAGGLIGYAPLLAAEAERTEAGSAFAWLLLVLLGTAACDTGAYFAGSLLGRRKLIPHISPAKTWEGLAGGTLGAVVAALAFSGLLGLSMPIAVVLGLVVCAAAVCGDLCESLLKRAAGVKDSGHVIPGHGGVLDRIDSILFVLPAVYWFAQVT
ncbi:MAG TPA: phosphatidate cytidylyltransferase [Chloroflexia bacterium]